MRSLKSDQREGIGKPSKFDDLIEVAADLSNRRSRECSLGVVNGGRSSRSMVGGLRSEVRGVVRISRKKLKSEGEKVAVAVWVAGEVAGWSIMVADVRRVFAVCSQFAGSQSEAKEVVDEEGERDKSKIEVSKSKSSSQMVAGLSQWSLLVAWMFGRLSLVAELMSGRGESDRDEGREIEGEVAKFDVARSISMWRGSNWVANTLTIVGVATAGARLDFPIVEGG